MPRRRPEGSLTNAERALGWVSWHCPEHGFLASASAEATVVCRCSKRARPYIDDRPVSSQDMSRLRSAKRPRKTPAKRGV